VDCTLDHSLVSAEGCKVSPATVAKGTGLMHALNRSRRVGDAPPTIAARAFFDRGRWPGVDSSRPQAARGRQPRRCNRSCASSGSIRVELFYFGGLSAPWARGRRVWRGGGGASSAPMVPMHVSSPRKLHGHGEADRKGVGIEAQTKGATPPCGVGNRVWLPSVTFWVHPFPKKRNRTPTYTYMTEVERKKR
jgi:hypothetical protein